MFARCPIRSDRISPGFPKEIVPPSEYRPLKLVLIDDDSVFRLGLSIWLHQFSDLEVVATAERGASALEILSKLSAATDPTRSVDLVVLDLALGQANPTQIQGLTLCQQIRAQYPQLPILLLSSFTEPVMLAAARSAGATSYAPKALETTDLLAVIQKTAGGQSCWIPATTSPSPVVPADSAPVSSAPQTPLVLLRYRWRRAGMQRIEAALTEIAAQLQNPDLSLLDRAVLAGRRRELRASRWLVDRLLTQPELPDLPTVTEPAPASLLSVNPVPLPQSPASMALPITVEFPLTTARTLQSVLWDRVLIKLQASLQNQTDAPLEIDILRLDKKRELFYLILRNFEELLDDLRFSQIQPKQLLEKRSLILQNLWKAAITDFFGKYYTVQVNHLTLDVADTLFQETEMVQTAILDRVPFAMDLIAHLLFQTPLVVEGVASAAGSPEALARAEMLLENLLIQTANAVMQPLLNRFSNIEAIQQSFYDYRLISSREIEKFRNNLSWKYRIDQVINEPKAIFESQYCLFIFSSRGIFRTSIYALRHQELEQLAGIQLVVTLVLETRDAIAPRLRSAVSWLGSGVVYVLTEVVGRGLGLIGRGILKGMGGGRDQRDRAGVSTQSQRK
jgi:DNA-binding NarL/FixJ family response regulator